MTVSVGGLWRMNDEQIHILLIFFGVVLFFMIVIAWGMRG